MSRSAYNVVRHLVLLSFSNRLHIILTSLTGTKWSLIKELTSVFNTFLLFLNLCLGSPRDVIAKVVDSGLKVSEFELQSSYYVSFRTDTLGKDITPIIYLAMD